MSFYLLILVLVISIPLAFSFEKNLRLYKRWKYIFGAIGITFVFFITWDIIFTHHGCWVFNDTHTAGIKILKLPLEEYLFFISIPYACIFTFYAIRFHFPQFKAGIKLTKQLTIAIVPISVIVALTNTGRLYTLVNFLVLPVIILISYWKAREVLQYYYPIFLVLILPFLLVNGILTGTGIDQAVFTYNQDVIMGIHILSVPVEDLFYAFSLLLMVFATTEILECRTQKPTVQ